MGKDFYDNVEASRATFEEASMVLGWDVAALCFGDDERIDLTEYAQPAILATEVAMYRGLQELYGFTPEYFGGHSLGEYAALVAAGAMPFDEALKAVSIRGRLMQQAVPPGEGAMAAVIADDLDIDRLRGILSDLEVDIANINSASQVVISGGAKSVEIVHERLKAAVGGGSSLRFVPLNVSAPFHSRFMNAIKGRFREVLETAAARLNPGPAARVTSNYTGRFHRSRSASIVDDLVAQVSGAVKWRDNMQALAERAHRIYEIGPNRPLKRFFQSIGIQCRSITSFSAAAREFRS
jgi:[acyl-carrier-protein] S-malonyltransferase/trans-AT polyketide synthase/acyltransferase/oxidoreductase domain-containing protein